nr:MAG TPA: hypothetical protein [Caudoviricetes sp.]DAZ53216.1 MAG TPA: hypothetical protein [Caudoviricetes sp.]
MIADIRLVLFIVMLFAFNPCFFNCIAFAHGVFGIAIEVSYNSIFFAHNHLRFSILLLILHNTSNIYINVIQIIYNKQSVLLIDFVT